MVDAEWPDLRPALGDRDVPGAVMPHQHHVVCVVHRVVLGERPADAQRVQDFHRLDVLDLVLAGDRNAPRRQQRIAQDDRAHRLLVLGDADPLVVVGE
jgi:hypothetical protein